MNAYRDALQSHLADYKIRRLGITQQGIWKGRDGVLHTYGHILPDGLEYLNLLESIRAEMRAYLAGHTEVKLHKDFKHLNSSQALAFNLFFPYFSAGGASARALSSALGLDMEVPREAWQFEEIQDEKTNVDVVWESATGQKVYCEVKLSEAEFGKAKNDDTYLDRLCKIYRPRLTGLVSPDLLEANVFFEHYQLLRNISLLHNDSVSQLLILFPRANSTLIPQLERVLTGIQPSHRHRVHVAHLEDVIDSLCSSESLPPELRFYASALREKYIPERVSQG